MFKNLIFTFSLFILISITFLYAGEVKKVYELPAFNQNTTLSVSSEGNYLSACNLYTGCFFFDSETGKYLSRFKSKDKGNYAYAKFVSETEAYIIFKDTLSNFELVMFNFLEGAEISRKPLPVPRGNFKIWLSKTDKYMFAELERSKLTDTTVTYIYDFETLQLKHTLDGITLPGLCGADVSPDESKIAALSFELGIGYKVKYLDISNFEIIKEAAIDYFPMNTKPMFSHDGKYLVLSQERTLSIMHWEKMLVMDASSLETHAEYLGHVTKVFMSNDKNYSYIRNNISDSLFVYDLDAKIVIKRFSGFTNLTTATDFNNKIILQGTQPKITAFDINSGDKLSTLYSLGYNHKLWGFSQEEDQLFIFSSSIRKIGFIDYTGLQDYYEIDYDIKDVRIENTDFMANKNGNTIQIKDIRTGEVHKTINLEGELERFFISDDLKYIQLLTRVYIPQQDEYYLNTIKEIETLNTVFSYDSLNTTGKLIEKSKYNFSHNSVYIAGMEMLRKYPLFVIRNLITGNELYSRNPEEVLAYCYSHDDKYIFIKTNFHTIEKIEIETGEVVLTLDSAGSYYSWFIESPNEKLLFDATTKEGVILWDLQNLQKHLIKWDGYSGRAVTFLSPDAKHFAAQDVEGSVYVWNIENVFTSVNELTESRNSEIEVYPQPAGEYANVAFETESAGTYAISLFDIHGRKVSEQTVDGGQHGIRERIDVSSFPDGVYMIRIVAGSKVLTGKIIVN